MAYKVAKPFKTVNRKFIEVGAKVSDEDISGAVSFDTWVERGFIVSDSPVETRKPISFGNVFNTAKETDVKDEAKD